MDKDLIKEILEYVEGMEEQIDNEWGTCRSFEEILKDHEDENEGIPEFYFKLKSMLD